VPPSQARPGSPERARYLFRDGRGPFGAQPPNNWRSVFWGPAWTKARSAVFDDDGNGATRLLHKAQWYLDLFDSGQPDLDWTNPEVRAEFDAILRFWLDRGVDGFRVDVAHGLVKREGLPDWDDRTRMAGVSDRPTRESPMWDQDGVHEIYRGWRATLEEYGRARPDGTPDPDSERILVAEAWVEPIERVALYVRPDEMHQAFDFHYLNAPWRAPDLKAAVGESLRGNDLVGAPTTWVLSNHDVVRHASRLGLPVDVPCPSGIGADDPQPDAELGLRRARAATTLMLALPGSAYLYQGEELGLPDHTALPDDVRQDPAFHRSGGRELGRDGCRIPMPWKGEAPAAGFNTTGETWLPQPACYAELAVDRQRGVEGSTLELYRTLLRVRRDRGLGRAGVAEVADTPPDVVAYDLQGIEGGGGEGPRTRVVLNLGEDPILASVDTWRLEEKEAREEVLDRLDELVVKPVDGSGGKGIVIGPRANAETLERLRRQILRDARGWIAQPVVQLSTVPTMIDGQLKPRHVDLRPFAINDGNDVWVLPGGLTRVALPKGEMIVNSSRGGGSKDTWVLTETRPTVDVRRPAEARPPSVPLSEQIVDRVIRHQHEQQQQSQAAVAAQGGERSC